jgi:hypothetical protein
MTERVVIERARLSPFLFFSLPTAPVEGGNAYTVPHSYTGATDRDA